MCRRNRLRRRENVDRARGKKRALLERPGTTTDKSDWSLDWTVAGRDDWWARQTPDSSPFSFDGSCSSSETSDALTDEEDRRTPFSFLDSTSRNSSMPMVRSLVDFVNGQNGSDEIFHVDVVLRRALIEHSNAWLRFQLESTETFVNDSSIEIRDKLRAEWNQWQYFVSKNSFLLSEKTFACCRCRSSHWFCFRWHKARQSLFVFFNLPFFFFFSLFSSLNVWRCHR